MDSVVFKFDDRKTQEICGVYTEYSNFTVKNQLNTAGIDDKLVNVFANYDGNLKTTIKINKTSLPNADAILEVFLVYTAFRCKSNKTKYLFSK